MFPPARRYWAEDIIDPEVTVSAQGTIHVPDSPGLGYTPKRERIDKLAVRKEQFDYSAQLARLPAVHKPAGRMHLLMLLVTVCWAINIIAGKMALTGFNVLALAQLRMLATAVSLPAPTRPTAVPARCGGRRENGPFWWQWRQSASL